MIILVILQLIILLVSILVFTQEDRKAVGICTLLIGALSIGMAVFAQEDLWTITHTILGLINIVIGIILITKDE